MILMGKNNRINSGRLREARLFRLKTLDELAQTVGINKQAISQYENDKTSPEPMTLKRIADVLGFPYSFFAEQDEDSIVGNTYFRALYSSRKKDLAAQEIKAKYLARIYAALAQKIRFRPLNLPSFENADDMSIEDVAGYVREYWGLGDAPIPNMVSLLERNGIIVGEFATESREIDAFYQYNEFNGVPTFCVILGTDKKSYYRRQFNCAHELGHIILHERYADLHELNREDFRKREDEANAFAAAFLLPSKAFGKDVSLYPNRLSHYVELKSKWNVSMMAMIMRAYGLKYLSDNQYTYLMRQMTARGYRQIEPLDNSIEYKHPQAFKQAIELLRTKANYSNHEILNIFSDVDFTLSSNVVEELLNLEKGSLSDSDTFMEESNIVEFFALKS